jgi:hypothetical protein
VYLFIDYTLLINNANFIQDVSTGVFYQVDTISDRRIMECRTKRIVKDRNNNVYNAVDNMAAFELKKHYHNNSIITIDNDVKKVAKYIKDTTFGIELETINGSLPDYITNKLGIITCKDGSTKDEDGYYPPEYVSVPLKGAKGIQTAREMCKEVTKHSDIDLKCSYHLHMGGFKMDRVFLVSMYKLCHKIQDSIFDMFPYYKRDEVKYANKEKNYCKKLPFAVKNYVSGDFNNYINSSYENIYFFLSGGFNFTPKYNFKRKFNPWGNQKWNISSRYYWLNFTNLVFGKQDTIEFRLHTPTTNSDKVINWLFICNAILGFARNNIKDCISDKPISIVDVLNYYKNHYKTSNAANLSDNLISYYNNRKAHYNSDFENGNYLSQGDLLTDSSFSFNTINV